MARLLRWYADQGRDLPWRGTRDPYRIWLSEIMLQQTTVAAVIDYYRRFLQQFPDVASLAAAPLEEVIELWAGLGYYSRARNLHAAARIIVDEHAGELPRTVAELSSLPGIGRSTAGAICALAFEQPAPILDGNVRRVLCRLLAFAEPPRTSRADKQLWHWSEQLTPGQRVHDYTQAIMDLGATVCIPRKPLCAECPLADLCLGLQQGLQEQLPLAGGKRVVPTRREVALLLEWRGRILVRRRLAEGFLGGLWEFPTLSLADDEDPQDRIRLLLSEWGLSGNGRLLGEIRHLYSHFRLQSQVYHLQCADCPRVGELEQRFVARNELSGLALHGAHKKVLHQFNESGV